MARRRALSKPEETLDQQLRASKIGGYVREHRFHPVRKWRLDFAFPAEKLAVEVQGGAWSGGRHTRGAGFTKDCEKFSELAILGWRLVVVTSEHVYSGKALGWIRRALDRADEKKAAEISATLF